ncbi:MAG: hypothetical protein K0Q95_3308 [Bacteroidota bacterium]|jgi:hypothetical protein|nr:hypothetical protein [Bacteroidota bacterium]
MPEETETEIYIEVEEVTAVETLMANENQVIVHCVCTADAAYRIWPTTFLIEQGSSRKARLLTAYNISFYPYWTLKNQGQKFTLVFEGLSRNCIMFDLKEEIPQEGGFHVKSILRNNSDVYTVDIG